MDSNLAGESSELELSNYLAVLWRHKVIILVMMLLGAVVAYQASSGGDTTYRSRSEVLLQQSQTEIALSPSQGNSSESRSRIPTAIEVMQSRSVTDAVKEELGYAPKITITQIQDTDLVSVSAQATSAKKAQTDAQTYTDVAVQVARDRTVNDLLAASATVQEQLDAVRVEIAAVEAPLTALDNELLAATTTEERQAAQIRADAARTSAASRLSSLRTRETAYSQQVDQLNIASKVDTTGGLQVVSQAELGERSGAKPRRNAVVGLIIGMLLGVVAAFVWSHFDDRLRNRRDLQLAAPGVGVLAVVPALRPGPASRRSSVVALTSPGSPAAEAFRALRTTVQVTLDRTGGKIVLITSPTGRDGTGAAETAANLAVTMARAGARAVLIDCDLHRPKLHSLFGLPNDVGLSSVLAGTDAVAGTLQQPMPSTPLDVVTSGSAHPDASDAMAGDRMRDVLRVLAAESDYVVVYCAPVLSVTDALVLAGTSDGVIVVAAGRKTRGRNLVRAIESLEQVDAPVMGTVLTGAPFARKRYGSNRKGRAEPVAPISGLAGDRTGSAAGHATTMR